MADQRIMKLVDAYLVARNTVIRCGFSREIEWQESVSLDGITESVFLKEAAWVVLACGMSDLAVRRVFPRLSVPFFCWKSSRSIARYAKECERCAFVQFRNLKKIRAIIDIACTVADIGFEAIKARIADEGTAYIDTFPFMGPASSRHLGKNIGLDIAKPDRHLLRLSAIFGFSSPQRLCEEIRRYVPERTLTIDTVLWRYATLCPNYLEVMSSALRKRSLTRSRVASPAMPVGRDAIATLLVSEA